MQVGKDSAVFPVFYFPSVLYFKRLLSYGDVAFERFENFQKQTYRSRCTILSPNGRLNLSVPIQHDGTKLYKDISISYDYNWQKEHFKSIESAYRSSPYFEYYENEFRELIFTKNEFLFDLNIQILKWISKKLDFESFIEAPTYSQEYKEDWTNDYRNKFVAKRPTAYEQEQFLNQASYLQVFSSKFDFVNNLSVIDLLFNQGPLARKYILQ